MEPGRGCRRGEWAPLFLTLPATLKCGEGEPPPLFQREAQRGQVAGPKLCRAARTRTQNPGLPMVRASAVVLQCPRWVEGVRFSGGKQKRESWIPSHTGTPSIPHPHPCPQIPPHHLSGYLTSWSVHCSPGKGWASNVPLLTRGPYYPPNWTRAEAEAEGSASRTLFGRGRGRGTTPSSLQVPHQSLRPFLESPLLLFLNRYKTDSDQLR